MILQAVASGVLDCRKAPIRDRRWKLKLHLLLDQLDRQNQAALIRDQLYHRSLNLLGLPINDQSYREVWDECLDIRQHIENATRPWAYRRVLTKQQKLEALADRYVEEFGDPNDPEYDAEIDRLLDSWGV